MTRAYECLIDSNIIVYSLNKEGPHFEKAAQVFDKMVSGEINGIIAHQNILESVRVLTHPKHANPMSSEQAFKAINVYIQVCKIIYPGAKTAITTQEFVLEHDLKGNLIYDAYLAATMLENGIKNIITANAKDFAFCKDVIKVINPFD